VSREEAAETVALPFSSRSQPRQAAAAATERKGSLNSVCVDVGVSCEEAAETVAAAAAATGWKGGDNPMCVGVGLTAA